MAATIERISPQDAHSRLESNPDALLVCAYDDPVKFEQNHLEGAMSLPQLAARINTLPKNREIIFYCA
jgi:rhodanese-related sulfurtransferase